MRALLQSDERPAIVLAARSAAGLKETVVEPLSDQCVTKAQKENESTEVTRGVNQHLRIA